MHTDTASQPTAEARDAMGAIAPPPSPSTAEAPSPHLPGITADSLAHQMSRCRAHSGRRLTDRVRHTAFLCPVPADEEQDRYVRVTGLACPPGTPDDLVGLVVVSPPGDLFALTLRELVVLGLVIDWLRVRGRCEMGTLHLRIKPPRMGPEVFDLPPRAAEVAVEVAALADLPASLAERAEAILHPLREVIPFQAVRIALLDPEVRQHEPLSCHGYNDHIRAYMTTPEDYDEIESLGLHGTTPLRIQDLPVPAQEIRSWMELFRPAGFLEGLGVGLVTREGRQVGLLGLNTDRSEHPSRAACNLVQLLAPTIAYAVDPLRSLAVLARIVQRMTAATVLTMSGGTLPLPGLPTHPLLEGTSSVLPAGLAHLGGTPDYATFLVPYDRPPAEAGHVRITLFGSDGRPPRHLRAVVAVSAPGDLHGLTGTELEILGALVDGAAVASIAVARGIPVRTVESHLERIRIKLAVPDQITAGLRAAREGLYVPAEVAAGTR